MQPYAVKECSDKLALMNFAVYNIQQFRNEGINDEQIKQMLSEQFEFSDALIDQIM